MVVFPSFVRLQRWHIVGLLFGMRAWGRVSPHAHLALTPTRRAAVALRTHAASGSRSGSLLVIMQPLHTEFRTKERLLIPAGPVREDLSATGPVSRWRRRCASPEIPAAPTRRRCRGTGQPHSNICRGRSPGASPTMQLQLFLQV